MLCRTYFEHVGSGYCHKATTDMRQKRDNLIKGGMRLSGPTFGPPRKLLGKRSEGLSGRTLKGSKIQWPPDGPDLGLGKQPL